MTNIVRWTAMDIFSKVHFKLRREADTMLTEMNKNHETWSRIHSHDFEIMWSFPVLF
jgi:hypothetical protein